MSAYSYINIFKQTSWIGYSQFISEIKLAVENETQICACMKAILVHICGLSKLLPAFNVTGSSLIRYISTLYDMKWHFPNNTEDSEISPLSISG